MLMSGARHKVFPPLPCKHAAEERLSTLESLYKNSSGFEMGELCFLFSFLTKRRKEWNMGTEPGMGAVR